MSTLTRLYRRSLLPFLLLFVLTTILSACDNGTNGTPTEPSNAIEISFAYSSEKQPWIDPLAAQFNGERHTMPGDNRPIYIKAFVADSGTARQQIVSAYLHGDKTLQPIVWSPSNSLWKSVLNFEADQELAGSGPGESDPLLLNPVVLAMWRPMAQAMGWPDKPIGLKDILDLNKNPQGWGAFGHPEWGPFKYAHTNPEVSSTGLSTVTAEFYAGAGKTSNLTEDDVNNPDVRAFVQSIESSIVHYSSTTTIFKDNIRQGGMSYISAVALEEQTVIDLNRNGNMPTPLAAIYPKEGTFWHDNPYIILKAPWVSDDQRKAAAVFRDYLLTPENQQKALALGFRPANSTVSYRTEPFTLANGVDVNQPKTTLQVPPPRVLEAVKNAWGVLRKEANIMLVLDVSPSMDDQDKLTNALDGIRIFLNQTRDVDRVGFVAFDRDAHVLVPIDTLSKTRSQILAYVDHPENLPRNDSTAIYDGVAAGLDELDRLNDHTHINAIVLLTDGKDNSSSSENRRDVPNRLSQNRDQLWAVKLFPIAYGSGDQVDKDVLQQFATITQTSLVSGDVTDIKKIYDQMSNYF